MNDTNLGLYVLLDKNERVLRIPAESLTSILQPRAQGVSPGWIMFSEYRSLYTRILPLLSALLGRARVVHASSDFFPEVPHRLVRLSFKAKVLHDPDDTSFFV